MNCPKCGNELNTDVKLCAKCGATVAPAQPPKEYAEPKPVEPQKPTKQKKGKKNLVLKIVAIVLALIVFLTGGLFITDAILFKSESEDEGYITDFPVLKIKTELVVYDAEVFPYEDYNIKVDKFKTGKVFKSSTFSTFENVINERSNASVFSIDFKEDGKYRITLEGIVSERTQAVTESVKQEEPKTIVIIAVVDNDAEDAVGEVSVNSQKSDKQDENTKAPLTQEEIRPDISDAEKIVATEADFENFIKFLEATNGSFDNGGGIETYKDVADMLYSTHGRGYEFFFGNIDYTYKNEYYNEVRENAYAVVPKENVKWICESVYNIKFNDNFESSSIINGEEKPVYIDGDYCYMEGFVSGDGGTVLYEITEKTAVEDKYRFTVKVYYCEYGDESNKEFSGITLTITAALKKENGKRFWSVYSVNMVNSKPSEDEDTTPTTPTEPSTPSTQAPTQTPTQPTQTPTQPTQTPSVPSGTVQLDKNVKVGDYVKFGKYEQDNNTSNGKEDIEWLVLENQGGKVLLISRYGLDAKRYNESGVDVTWENCTLRKWLNNDFYNMAFSNSEKSKVSSTNVIAEDNVKHGTDAGNNTQDKVFLLSTSQAEKYFTSDEDKFCKPTQYAAKQAGLYDGSTNGSYNGYCYWWLRSPGILPNYASYVHYLGVDYAGNFVICDTFSVRPAMWITVD